LPVRERKSARPGGGGGRGEHHVFVGSEDGLEERKPFGMAFREKMAIRKGPSKGREQVKAQLRGLLCYKGASA